MQEFASAFYHSRAWRRTQAAYMLAPVDKPGAGVCPPRMCERCFEEGRLVPAEIVHHVVWLTPDNIDDPETALSWGNLMRVCRDCHAAIHNPGAEPRVRFGEDGEVLPL